MNPRFFSSTIEILEELTLEDGAPIAYYSDLLMNPLADVFCPNYDTLLQSLSLYPVTEPPSALLSPDYFQEPAVQVPEVPEEPEPRDSGPASPSLHHPHLDLPAGPTVRYPARDDGDTDPSSWIWQTRRNRTWLIPPTWTPVQRTPLIPGMVAYSGWILCATSGMGSSSTDTSTRWPLTERQTSRVCLIKCKASPWHSCWRSVSPPPGPGLHRWPHHGSTGTSLKRSDTFSFVDTTCNMNVIINAVNNMCLSIIRVKYQLVLYWIYNVVKSKITKV